MVRVKICGITNSSDALAAAEAGADILGFNFYGKSPRYVSPAEAAVISKRLPPNVWRVGIFVNEAPAVVRKIAVEVGLTHAQLHGDEDAEAVKDVQVQVIKAIRVRAGVIDRPVEASNIYAYLIDSYSPEYGGSGIKPDQNIAKIIAQVISKPFILAGGLTPGNVADAIRIYNPFGVDVASGVEISPGKKDHGKVREFIKNAKGHK